MKAIRYKTRDSWGNVWQHEMLGVATWADEKSDYDPFTLRVMRDAQGRLLGGPVVGEFFDWTEHESTEPCAP